MLPCATRDAVYVVQENNMVSLRVAKYKSTSAKRLTDSVPFNLFFL